MGYSEVLGPNTYASWNPNGSLLQIMQTLQDAGRSSPMLRNLLAGLFGDDGGSQAASYAQYPGALGWGPALTASTGEADPTKATQAGIFDYSAPLLGGWMGAAANLLGGKDSTAFMQNLVRGGAGGTGVTGPSVDAAMQARTLPMVLAAVQASTAPMLAGIEGLRGAHQAAWSQQQNNNQSLKNTLLSAVLSAALNNQTVSWHSGLAANAPPAQSPTSGGGGSGGGGFGSQAPGLYEQKIAEQKAQEKENSLAAYMQNLGMAYSGLSKGSTYGGMRDTSGMYNNVQDYSGYA